MSHHLLPSRTRCRISISSLLCGMVRKELWKSISTTAQAPHARSARRVSDAILASLCGR
jgi:hypothetical protein